MQHESPLPPANQLSPRCHLWNENVNMTTTVESSDPATIETAPRAGRLSCGCGSSLAPWGHARTRSLRGLAVQLRQQRPRRARCPACRATTMLPTNWYLPRRRDTIEVIGTALTAHAASADHHPITRRLGVPDSTVRDWLPRAHTHRTTPNTPNLAGSDQRPTAPRDRPHRQQLR